MSWHVCLLMAMLRLLTRIIMFRASYKTPLYCKALQLPPSRDERSFRNRLPVKDCIQMASVDDCFMCSNRCFWFESLTSYTFPKNLTAGTWTDWRMISGVWLGGFQQRCSMKHICRAPTHLQPCRRLSSKSSWSRDVFPWHFDNMCFKNLLKITWTLLQHKRFIQHLFAVQLLYAC